MEIRSVIRMVIEEELLLIEEAKPRIPERVMHLADKIYQKIQDGTPPGQIQHSKQLRHLKEGSVTYSIEIGISHRMVYHKTDNSYVVMSHEDYNRWWKKRV